MKKMFFAVSALAALSLLAPTMGFAQGADNQLGFYSDADMSSSSLDAAAYSTVEVFMIVTNPYNDTENRAIESIFGIEFSVMIPAGTAQVISTTWTNNANAIDVDNTPDNHIVGWGLPVPTVGGVIQLGTKSVLLLTADPFVIHIAPHITTPSIPGAMAILDFDGSTIQPIYPSSGSYDNPVFGFNTTVVATEPTSFDNVKALYR